MKEKLLLYLLGFIALAGLNASASTYRISFAFDDNSSLYSGWSSSYAEHTVVYEDCVQVYFASADKNSSTITDIPVTKGADVVVSHTGLYEITAVSLTLTQWNTKAQTVYLNSSSDGSDYTQLASSSDFYISSSSLPDGTKYVKFSFSSSSNQVGISAMEITFDDASGNKGDEGNEENDKDNPTTSSGNIPAGYYDPCVGLSAQALLTALEDIVYDHTALSYAGLWTAFATTDVDENGKIWDMYSTKRFTYYEEQEGKSASSAQLGDCYNREHSMPKSWFGDATPMYTDLFHIYPTDKYVNAQRGNYPYGECANGTTLSSVNGVDALGRLGASTFTGYTDKVFEPDDEYKGDFARSYFYMAAAYNSKVSSWSSDQLAGNSYPVFSTWSVNLLYKWHTEDPVSQKELDRQEAVYAIQGNRNPFIDHPEMADHIWGTLTSIGWQATSVADIAVDDSYSPLWIYSDSGTVYCSEKFRLYNLQGRDMTSANGSLPAGLYIVRTPTAARKLLVK